MGTQPHLQKGGRAPSPIFGPFLLWPNGWMHQDATRYRCRPQLRRLCLRWRPSSPFPQRGGAYSPIFVHFYCGQTVGCNRCIKMPLGMKVGLGLCDIVFDVDPATVRKKADPPHPIFGPCLLWPNGWMDEDAARYGSRPRPTRHCTRQGPSSRERGTAAPLFSAHVYCGHSRPSQLLLSFCVV